MELLIEGADHSESLLLSASEQQDKHVACVYYKIPKLLIPQLLQIITADIFVTSKFH